MERWSSVTPSQPVTCRDWLDERFPKDRDRELKDEIREFLALAKWHFQQGARLQARASELRKEDVRRLRVLGGRLTQARRSPGQEAQVEEIKADIRALRTKPKQLRWAVEQQRLTGQYFWHRAQVLLYACLPLAWSRRRRSDMNSLYQYLSMPEFSRQCTVNSIKAARRRFYNDRGCLTYELTPLSSHQAKHQLHATPKRKRAHLQEGVSRCRTCRALVPVQSAAAHLLEHMPYATGRSPQDSNTP